VFVNEVVVKPDTLAVLFHAHTLDVAVLHLHFLFLFQNYFHLTALF
jgi:hypothetical protein